MNEYISCSWCGAQCLNIEGECHKYMLSSPGCWEMFNEVLEREYSDLRYWKAHQFTVDAYACQHVGKKEDKRAVNSVNIHLASLYMMFEMNVNIHDAPTIRTKFSQFYKGKNLLEWLEPPASMGELTIFEIWDNNDVNKHYKIAERWAKSVWQAWVHQHKTIANLVNAIK